MTLGRKQLQIEYCTVCSLLSKIACSSLLNSIPTFISPWELVQVTWRGSSPLFSKTFTGSSVSHCLLQRRVQKEVWSSAQSLFFPWWSAGRASLYFEEVWNWKVVYLLWAREKELHCSSPLWLREEKMATWGWFYNQANSGAHFEEQELEGEGGMQNAGKLCLALPSSAPWEGVGLKESLFNCLDVFLVNCKNIRLGIACGKMISHRWVSKAAYCSFSLLLVLTTLW